LLRQFNARVTSWIVRWRAITPTDRRLAVAGRTVLLVDDGLVSSRKVQAAARSLRGRGATRIILAVPVAEASSAITVREWVEEVVCLQYRREPRAVRFWYDDYSEPTEQEVTALLSEHVGARAREVDIEVEPATVPSGQLTVPRGCLRARGGPTRAWPTVDAACAAQQVTRRGAEQSWLRDSAARSATASRQRRPHQSV